MALGVTTYVATTGEVPLLTVVNEGIFPVPPAASPIPGVLLVHAKVVPLTGPDKLIALVTIPLPYSPALIRSTVGLGFIVKVPLT